jgi:hypothetical protein
MLSAVSMSACRLADCPPPALSASAIAVQATAAHPFAIQGRVVSIEGVPLPRARVRLVPTDSLWHPVNADGRFTMQQSTVGAQTLEVSAEGYDLASALMVMRPDTGIEVLVAMVETRPVAVNSACDARVGTRPAD